MEAAAKTVQLLTQRILPDKPHHLSYFPDWRYRVPAESSKPKSKKHFEEWDNRRLQYTTLVSEADRGVLMTRSYYDMRVEPQKPVPRELNNLAKSGVEKKKLSLSDYKNKKTGVASDTSTPEPASARKKDAQRAAADSRPVPEIRRPDGHKSREAQHIVDNKSQKLRENIVVDMRYLIHPRSDLKRTQTDQSRLPPKPPTKASLPPRPMSPESRKRGADDDDLRPPKRPRPDVGRVSEDRSRTPRDELPRRKDRNLSATYDRDTAREKPASSLLPNGRVVSKSATGANRVPSPAGRVRGDSVNGVRPSINVTSASSKNTPKDRHERDRNDSSSSKSSVPPLLSPLHLNLDSHDASENRERKRAREDAVDGTRSSKTAKKLEPPPPQRKRERTPVELPPLLSPTLPPIVEAELSRIKAATPKPVEAKAKDDRSKDKENRAKDKEDRRREDRGKVEKASSIARKAPVEQDDEDSSEKERPRKQFIVTLKIPKKLRQTVERILRLPQGKGRHERDASSDLPPPSQAKKRPVNNSEKTEDTISVKRPRPSDFSVSSRLPPPPSTPSKKTTTAMERVSSNNSQVDTPGDGTTATPSVPGSSERPVNGTDNRAEIRAQNDRQSQYVSLGRTLKHRGQNTRQNASLHAPDAVNGNSRNNPRYKLGCVYMVESLLAFITSFKALNNSRALQGKPGDPAIWESLFPFLDHAENDFRRLDQGIYRPLYVLVLWLHQYSIEQYLKCYDSFAEPDDHITVKDYVRHSRIGSRLSRTVQDIFDSNYGFMDSDLCVNVRQFQTAFESSVLPEVLRILRLWCEAEGVDWTPEVHPRQDNYRQDIPRQDRRNAHGTGG
ncbi:Fc.00g014870.m01.CDS01 [Cosmosporella sp. VM-42]